MPRLSIEIERDQHRQIKTLATFSGMTIKDYILSRTLSAEDEGTDATRQLLSGKRNAARLLKAIRTPASKSRKFGSLSELKDALGI